MEHIWYGCHGVREFWDKIFDIYHKVTGKEIRPKINSAILSIFPGSIKTIKTDILHHRTTAARKVIAHKWKSTTNPTIVECICGQIREEGN